MKLFRILIVFLDMEIFVIGQDTKMISSGGLEMFPILRSSQYFPILRSSKTYISFLNRTVRVLNCSCHKLAKFNSYRKIVDSAFVLNFLLTCISTKHKQFEI